VTLLSKTGTNNLLPDRSYPSNLRVDEEEVGMELRIGYPKVAPGASMAMLGLET
jgi:hypothetical protein